jgi:hypothetical protein
MTGYSQTELDDIQSRWSLRFPPDLVALLREQRYPAARWPRSSTDLWRIDVDWIYGSESHIKQIIARPVVVCLHDAERNKVWWGEWEERPATRGGRYRRLRKILDGAPKMIPVRGVYLPEEPCESGNPVFSLMGFDGIYAGANLADWLERNYSNRNRLPWPPIKEIRFWSDLVRKNKFNVSAPE